MKQKAMNLLSNLPPGTVITGKWHHKTYRIKKKLGSGAVGSVYLCDAAGQEVALKISDKSASLTVEVNVLTSLKQVQGSLGPYLLDVDDWVTRNGKVYSFYVMEYVRGIPLRTFIKQHGSSWIGVFMLQLLDDLTRLHQSGWIFGDLKLDNLIVMTNPPRLRWVDVGGTTQKGRAIKEYTEFYDRGYWQLGTRRAEESYDLFALTMVFLHLFYPNEFERREQPLQQLYRRIDQVKALAPYRKILKKAISGKYQTSTEMRRELFHIVSQNTRTSRSRRSRKKQDNLRHAPFVIETLGITIIALGYYLLSLFL
ncbi:putative serine/threonine-protein kinase YabT [Compostibacillus humi]|uniref:Putative serine/threonine-protein kinase YabT n=1 Tax=Compostibacillus humi TaxID=1245525 RepID=A0A8J2TP84_9BACI|nr:protein kinase [Compostibacillus humi]GFZ82350.1 putative serine/threonine-protein kinase YabT [Compostibacillus humi]HLT55793.1 protein kinase [Bacillota bacterium]